MLSTGDGVPMNKKEAVHYYKMSVMKGHANSMFKLACMYYNGDGIPVNKNEAYRLYKLGYEKGNLDAMYNYALMLNYGE